MLVLLKTQEEIVKSFKIYKYFIISQNSTTGKYAVYFFTDKDLRPDLMLIRSIHQMNNVSGLVQFQGVIKTADFFAQYPEEKKNKKVIREVIRANEFGFLIFEE